MCCKTSVENTKAQLRASLCYCIDTHGIPKGLFDGLYGPFNKVLYESLTSMMPWITHWATESSLRVRWSVVVVALGLEDDREQVRGTGRTVAARKVLGRLPAQPMSGDAIWRSSTWPIR